MSMAGNSDERRQALEFVYEKIDSVPQLEALLLLWNSRSKAWTRDELAARLYVEPGEVSRLLEDLRRADLIEDLAEGYRYHSPSPERDQLIGMVDAIYRQELVRVTSMIHSKVSSSVRDFARAFRFKKEPE
jgi:DNA-binding transcriptional ArsR family regulator